MLDVVWRRRVLDDVAFPDNRPIHASPGFALVGARNVGRQPSPDFGTHGDMANKQRNEEIMIRKALLIAAVVVMPATTLSAITLGAGVAGAKGGPAGPITCATSGSVTVPEAGTSYDGSLTSKANVDSKSTFTGSGTGCSTKAIKLTIVSATTVCAGAMSPPEACMGATSKKPNYYDDTAGFAGSSTTTDVYNALAAGIKTSDNGTKVTLEQPPSSSDVTAVVNGPCGSNTVGFQVTNGPVNDNGGPSLTWSTLTCFTADTGSHTTGNFDSDLFASGGGNASITIATRGYRWKLERDHRQLTRPPDEVITFRLRRIYARTKGGASGPPFVAYTWQLQERECERFPQLWSLKFGS